MVDGAAGDLGQHVGVTVQDQKQKPVQIQVHLMEDQHVQDMTPITPPALEMIVPKCMASGAAGLHTPHVAMTA